MFAEGSRACQYDMQVEAPNVAYSGRLAQIKGLHTAVKVAQDLRHVNSSDAFRSEGTGAKRFRGPHPPVCQAWRRISALCFMLEIPLMGFPFQIKLYEQHIPKNNTSLIF